MKHSSVHMGQSAALMFAFSLQMGCGWGAGGEGKGRPLRRMVDDLESHARAAQSLAHGDGYRFAHGIGDGAMGYNILAVERDRSATYLFMEPKLVRDPASGVAKAVWRKASFDLTEDEYKSLREQLVSASLFDLKLEYHSDIVDGVQVIVSVALHDDRKSVYCNNFFPDPISKLGAFVSQLIKSHEAAARDAPVVEYDHESAWAAVRLVRR